MYQIEKETGKSNPPAPGRTLNLQNSFESANSTEASVRTTEGADSQAAEIEASTNELLRFEHESTLKCKQGASTGKL